MVTKRIAESYIEEIMKKLVAHGYKEDLVHLYIIFLRQRVHDIKANVVTGLLIFSGGVSQTDDQIHVCLSLLLFALFPIRHRRAAGCCPPSSQRRMHCFPL